MPSAQMLKMMADREAKAKPSIKELKETIAKIPAQKPTIEAPTKSDRPKTAISIRLDDDVLAALRSGGAFWQTRANDALRKHLGL